MGAISIDMTMPEQPQARLSLLLIAAIALLIAGGLILTLSLRQSLIIDHDGRITALSGRFDTVGQALEAAGVVPRDEDYIWPDPISGPPEEGVITIRSASAVEVTIDGQPEMRWTLQNNLASFLAEQNIGRNRSSTLAVDGRQIPWPAQPTVLAQTALGQAVDVSDLATVQIDDGQSTLTHETAAATVGQALIEAGIEVYAADGVDPPLNSWLRPDQQILVDRATPITVRLGGHELTARSSRPHVAGALAELGVGLIGRDVTLPGLDQPLDVDQITVDRASATYEIVTTPLPFASRMVPLADLEIDQRRLVSAGSTGELSQLRRVDVIGSEAISPTTIAEWTSQPATDEVIGYGTDIVVRTLDTPDGPISYWRVVRMRVTAYTAADAGKPPSHPAYGITASGRPAGYGIVAIDPNVVPFRSQVYVPGYGVGFAGDTGGGVKGRWIDLGYDEGQIEAWNGYVDVYYLTPVPAPERINYLIPTTLP